MEKKEERAFAYPDGRFEFIMYLNNFIIAKRNFNIPGYIEKSMHTLEFGNVMGEIHRMIDKDLKSKSMTYLWYNVWDGEFECLTENELKTATIEPWSCTFKIAVTDRGREVASRIWDGYCYPKAIRDKVDLTNKWVRITNSEGKVETFDKETFFESNKDRLSPKLVMMKEMMYHKPDVLKKITDLITDNCMSRNGEHQRISDYTTKFDYCGKSYTTDIRKYNNQLAESWSKAFKKTGK